MTAHLPSPRVVLSYGVFDRLTPAHAHRLQILSKMGSDLIIGCATDAFCARQGWQPKMRYAQRRALLESCRFVDRVIAQDSLSQKRTDIVNYNACIVALAAQYEGCFDDLRDLAQVRYLPQMPEFISKDIPMVAVG
ncbi:MAG: glycerol-3-phosphate cytidylyltransferase [Sulfitobacter sp.]